MKYLISIILVLCIGITSCQDVDSITQSIANANSIQCESIGFAGSTSPVYKKFQRLKRFASKEELIGLTYHDNPVVVGYASYALIDKELIEPYELLERFIDNSTTVPTFCGCLMGSETLSLLIYNRYRSSRIEYTDIENFDKFVIHNSSNLEKMDSLILYSDNPDWMLLASAFENRVYKDTYNEKIKEWAFDRNDFFALSYVYKHLKEENENKLIESFDTYLLNPENHEAQKKQISRMKQKLKSAH